MTGWKPRVCECGHTEAEHVKGGRVSLGMTGAPPTPTRGMCFASLDCDCTKFRLAGDDK